MPGWMGEADNRRPEGFPTTTVYSRMNTKQPEEQDGGALGKLSEAVPLFLLQTGAKTPPHHGAPSA